MRDAESAAARRPRRIYRHRGACITSALIAISLALAGCGGGNSGVPGVASAGTTTNAGKSSSAKSARASLVAFAQCMRAHGIEDFPEASGEGFAIDGGAGSDLNPDNPRYRSANGACKSLLPVHTVTPSQQAKIQARALKFAQCMRSHGVPNYPDPKVSYSGGGIAESQGIGTGIDPNSPQFKAAQRACQGGPPVGSSGGGSSQSGGEEGGGAHR